MLHGHSRRFAAGVALALPLTVFAQPSTTSSPDVRAACDQAYAMITKTAGAKVRRANGTFNDETFRSPVPGCRIQIAGSFKKAAKSGAAPDNLHTRLMSRGWREIIEFS